MTTFERAEPHSGNAMAEGKNQKKRRRPGQKTVDKEKWDAPPLPGFRVLLIGIGTI